MLRESGMVMTPSNSGRRVVSGGFPHRLCADPTLWIGGACAFLVVAALRVLTLAPDTWEWDELLFVGAARNGLDVRLNQPHPPGYPLFVFPARLMALAGVSPFGATLAVAFLAGIAAIVLLSLLARELGAGREESLWAGLVWACIPAVWLHAVRPLSDAAGAATFFLAALFLFRSARSPGGAGLVAAGIALGASIAVRPQVAIGLGPLAVVAVVRAARTAGAMRRIAVASAAGGGVVLFAYAPIVAGSGGVSGFLAASRSAAAYVRTFDTPSLTGVATGDVWNRWLIDPFGGPFPAAALWLASVGVVVSRRAIRRLAVLFVPLVLFSVATLNPATAPRYGMPIFSAAPLAAAIGLTVLRQRQRRLAALAGTGLLAVVALPAVRPLSETASRPSPPVAAMAALAEERALADRPVLVAPGLALHWEKLGPRVPWRRLEHGSLIPAPAGSLVVTHDYSYRGLRTLRVFRYESEALSRISRARYLSVVIQEPDSASALREPFKATNDLLLSSVDEPAEDAVVRAPLKVRGWGQERGGEIVVPVEFRIDGRSVAPVRLVRTPRPDVAAAIPEVGDGSRAGYEAAFPAEAIPAGDHVLEVVFETEHSRRVYPPRRFRLIDGPGDSGGPP